MHPSIYTYLVLIFTILIRKACTFLVHFLQIYTAFFPCFFSVCIRNNGNKLSARAIKTHNFYTLQKNTQDDKSFMISCISSKKYTSVSACQYFITISNL